MNCELSSSICYIRHSSALCPGGPPPPPAAAGNKTIIKENFSSAIHDVKFQKMEKQLSSRGRYIAARSLWQAGIKFCIIF